MLAGVGLLVDLLDHEVAVVALLDQGRRGRYHAGGALDRLAVGVEDLGPVMVDAATRNIQAQKLQPINKDTIDELVAIGL